ncbi:MAG: S8 family serine peptidase [candidate division WOR-3 bacterium]
MKKLFLFLVSFPFFAEEFTISFVNKKFDPLKSVPKVRELLQASEIEGENYYILQFKGPIYSEWKEKIVEKGGVFHSYIPNFAYIVRMTKEEKKEIEKLPFVRWIGLFHPEYKVHPGVYKRKDKHRENKNLPILIGEIENNKLRILESRECPCGKDELWVENDPLLHLLVRFFPESPLYEIASKLESWGSVIQEVQENNNLMIIRIPPDSLFALARIKEVESIEPYARRVLSSSTWRYSVQVPKDSFTIEEDNDLGQSWDTVTSGITLAEKGITGKGEIITIFDTGLDYWSGFFQDPESDLPGSSHIVVEAYTPEGGDDKEVVTSKGGCSHGTNVASIIAGNPSIADNYPGGKNLMSIYDWGGQTRGNVPDSFPVRLYIQDFGYNKGDSCKLGSFDLTLVMNKAYNNNSRIHQNSWNYSEYLGEYIGGAIEIDNMVWNKKDFVVVFSAGNFGPNDTTVAAPSTAKNCISVGASWVPSFDVSPDSVASFSSRGWTTDNRIKPDVVAPGGTTIGGSSYPHRYYLWGARPDTTWGTHPAHSWIVGMIGTSQAAPQVSGACAMIRQYFKDGFYPTGDPLTGTPFNPSAALVKAVLIASTIDMGIGGGKGNPVPNRAEGWGRVVLDNALFFSGESRVLFVSDNSSVSTGDSVVHTVTVENPSEPLKFVLAWSDYPANPLVNPTLVNDLDLTVIAPNDEEYKGNVFSGGYSQTGGDFDRRNNVEVVWLPNPTQTGTYKIKVKGYNCPNGSIPYAIAAVGGFTGGSGINEPLEKKIEEKNLILPSVFVGKVDVKLNIATPGKVNLSLYDITGRKVRTLVDERLEKGIHLVKFGENLSSGIYFFVLKIDGKKIEEKKIVKLGN